MSLCFSILSLIRPAVLRFCQANTTEDVGVGKKFCNDEL